jgi:hypothetical protein
MQKPAPEQSERSKPTAGSRRIRLGRDDRPQPRRPLHEPDWSQDQEVPVAQDRSSSWQAIRTGVLVLILGAVFFVVAGLLPILLRNSSPSASQPSPKTHLAPTAPVRSAPPAVPSAGEPLSKGATAEGTRARLASNPLLAEAVHPYSYPWWEIPNFQLELVQASAPAPRYRAFFGYGGVTLVLYHWVGEPEGALARAFGVGLGEVVAHLAVGPAGGWTKLREILYAPRLRAAVGNPPLQVLYEELFADYWSGGLPAQLLRSLSRRSLAGLVAWLDPPIPKDA